ncbi:unnamed protein product [Lymnaea stagnalis]|uniref:TIR domain-containing protein n=1 Tax=Lymnaea stagnalis TaxID=6523 RepID=A0AAV2IF02_LYMST
MISYNRHHKTMVEKINKALKDRNYKTWIDVEDMSGSTLDSMSTAIEDAAAVLVCMSPAYKTSKYCKLEAEYAYLRELPVIFLQMERDYKPDGWLGILLGDKLFYDFSGKYDFDSKLIQMMKELDKTLGQKAPQTKTTTANPGETRGKSETVPQTPTVNRAEATQQTDDVNKVEAVQQTETVNKMEVAKQTSGQSKHMVG